MCNKKNEAPMTGQVEVFNFSQEKAPIRVQLINSEPWFVAKDVCEVLGIANHKDAASRLDEDERRGVGITDPIGRPQTVTAVSESGLYSLVFQSRKAEAKKFRKWVTSEVLPSIRKKGYYGIYKPKTDFIDARDIPYETRMFNNSPVRCVTIDNETWYSMNDLHAAMGSRTESTQAAKKLNAKQTLAKKILLFGANNPGWFVMTRGAMLLLSASRKMNNVKQMELEFKED
ncbi:MAG: BRO family protein [Phocaeicola sp.]|jgi:Prophage antirepressor|uniref:BRO-N domain-containing protein n=1 Tax=Phocaeicola TaxID=909656 RepID=UPI00204A17DC|nr:BRO family protein [Phocaeicola coprocola]DAN78884.1 MAG TPA: repressor domain protein [Caudoviricetes sp.]DAV08698.1 MAG TPA: repressor domain protein [Caudoviricetes sp.]